MIFNDAAGKGDRGATSRVRIFVNTRAGSSSAGSEPITLGVPFPRGVCHQDERLRLWDDGGAGTPLQTRVLDRWPDGSIKWVLLDFTIRHDQPSAFDLTWHDAAPLPAPVAIQFESGRRGILVDTGVARFDVTAGANFPFRSVSMGGAEALDGERTRLLVDNADGVACETRVDAIAVEENGPLRVALRVTGGIFEGGHELVKLSTRLEFFAGLPTVRVALTLRNPRRAKHPGGIWELGDPGSIFLKDVSLSLGVRRSEASRVLYSAEPALPLQPSDGPFELYQDSSGGENWKSAVHVNAEGRVANRFRGYAVRQGTAESAGLRATPHVAVAGADAWVSVAMCQFWQNFPKAIDADERSLVLRLWPRQYASSHELQGGEQKTHVFYVSVGRDASEIAATDWCRQPSASHADPAWYCSTAAVPYLTPKSSDPRSDYLELVTHAVEGPNSFERKREIIDEYGWRHFGELYADHEAVFHAGPEPFISHYNNQYDAVAGFAWHFMCSGDARFWALMDDLARHVVDIDIYHTDQDKSGYNHGLFWHTAHYVDAGRCTHRTYPRAPKVIGGGPSNEHNYTTGLMLHHFLTGDPLSREAVLELAGWVVDMDDGGQSVFRWLTRSYTGLASNTRSGDYHGPGRGAAHSVHALLDAHRLTGDSVWMEKAEQLIRRCVHPQDDLRDRSLLHREDRWSYTAFLQELGRYLDYKAVLNQFDERYAYAQAALLHYAAWMAVNEYPYLDKPEELEFPTETWAAQDVRKSEVFDFAARHASGEDRARFLERAAFFWRYSVATVAGMPTGRLTRPLVLLLVHGFLRAHTAAHPDELVLHPPPEPPAFGDPVVFVGQKARAKRRLVTLAAAAALVATIAAAAAATFLLI